MGAGGGAGGSEARTALKLESSGAGSSSSCSEARGKSTSASAEPREFSSMFLVSSLVLSSGSFRRSPARRSPKRDSRKLFLNSSVYRTLSSSERANSKKTYENFFDLNLPFSFFS